MGVVCGEDRRKAATDNRGTVGDDNRTANGVVLLVLLVFDKEAGVSRPAPDGFLAPACVPPALVSMMNAAALLLLPSQVQTENADSLSNDINSLH